MPNPTRSVVFKNNKLKNKSNPSDFIKNSFKNKNNANGDSDEKYVSAAKGYNPQEGYFQSLLKSVQENPEPESYSKKPISIHQKELYKSAKQKQIIDYRKKSLTLKKKSD